MDNGEEDLAGGLAALEGLEKEFRDKFAAGMGPGEGADYLTWWVMGAASRTLSQSRGFRSMIESRNFGCAAILMRTQLDTAMRVNGLKFLEEPNEQLKTVFEKAKQFRQLRSHCRTSQDKAQMMTDTFLRGKLEEEEPWVGETYRKTSDFVHLSFDHFYTQIVTSDDEERMFYFLLNGEDASRSVRDYHEIVGSFFKVSRLTCTLILAFSLARAMAGSLQTDTDAG